MIYQWIGLSDNIMYMGTNDHTTTITSNVLLDVIFQNGAPYFFFTDKEHSFAPWTPYQIKTRL